MDACNPKGNGVEGHAVTTVQPVAAFVSRVSVKEHEMFSKIEIPHGWLVAFPRFEKALQLLKKTRKYVDADWAALDGSLERLIFSRVATAANRKNKRSPLVYGEHFTAVKGVDRQTRMRLGGPLVPKESAQNYSRRQRALMAQRPKPDQCEACGVEAAKICWDHDHVAGKFRGWICSDCNIALGFARDSPERLRRLAQYLEDAAIGTSPQ